MSDHLALLVNRLLTESTLNAVIASRNQIDEEQGGKDVEFLMPKEDYNGFPRNLVECRICQEDDFDSHMEIPCACCGSLKYAHRRCVQRWCNEKGDTICEICHQSFRPGYSAPPPRFHYRRLPINFRRNWQISRRELAESQLMQVVSTDRHAFSSQELEDHSSRSFICRLAVAVIFIGLLILRHTLPIMVGDADEFVLPQFILAMLRIAGILLLVYVTMIAVTGLKQQRNLVDLQESSSSTSTLDTSSDEESNRVDSQQPIHVIQIS